MADAAELKDLAWQNQWALAGGHAEQLPTPGSLAAPA